MTIQSQRNNTTIAELVGEAGLVRRANPLRGSPLQVQLWLSLAEYIQPLTLLSIRSPELSRFRSFDHVTSYQ